MLAASEEWECLGGSGSGTMIMLSALEPMEPCRNPPPSPPKPSSLPLHSNLQSAQGPLGHAATHTTLLHVQLRLRHRHRHVPRLPLPPQLLICNSAPLPRLREHAHATTMGDPAPSTSSTAPPKAPMTNAELVAFVTKELEQDDERQAKVQAAAAACDIPNATQTGSTLDLSHKNISVLPAEVVLLIKDRVERLALSHNPRISLPPAISQCDRLRYLNLRWNKLRHFPEAVLSLSKLEILDISKNQIDVIPEDIKKMANLKFLAVARNQIRRLPLALGEMNLVKLKFDENPIEFPPPEVLKPSTDRSLIESEKDKDMCQQVKRFMKATALRERLRASSDEDMRDSTVETPRPPKPGRMGGRFPVRPSISGIENIESLKSDSPPEPPPIPQRSHARGLSSNSQTFIKRPGIAPLLTGAQDPHRTRSETVGSSANIRNRRQGYVPRKNAKMNSLSEMQSQLSARSSAAPTLTPPHSRAPSVTSNYNGYLSAGGESSSGAISPIDGPVSRAMLSRKLSSLPESRNSRLPTINAIKAVRRVLFMLFYLHRPIADIAQQLGSGTPRRSTLERQVFSANAQIDELDRLLNNANNIMEDNMEVDSAMLVAIVRAAITALRMHVFVVKELNRNRQQIVKRVDAFHVRCVINSAYTTMLEAQNVCHMLGFETKPADRRNTLRISQGPWSSRTVTPTQPKPSGSRRRGATILPSTSSVTNYRGMVPPVPLHSNGSRSNTMTSVSTAATPRWNQSFPDLATQMSRSNTMRSVLTETDGEDNSDRLYFKLKACCDLAYSTLPLVRDDLLNRKTKEDRSGHLSISRMYANAVNKCDFAIATNNKLLARLKVMKLGDPARYAGEFKNMAETFTKDWAHFAEEVMALAREGLDIGNIKHQLKPLQGAVRDVTRTAQQSSPPSTKPPPSASLVGGFPPPLNTALAQQSMVPGPPTGIPVPATPIGAALGPAVQAIVPPTPTTSFNSAEYSFPPPPPLPTGGSNASTASLTSLSSRTRAGETNPTSYPRR
ncbi:uncharacterized protein MYCFIDRAFT_195140 [Pseudocercospora fijiensis CIRAD86]|uniref:Uncharacterized protein n=1 Tax=Pseudocercospora fijiensis (strain CIRAD86) TaxID=383855 RepID=M3B3I8_PSEFD|nr:uncharacterized protein MYCFIDRAFT_195140 [Pseudocercospora fijiensis CIRAD86]EME83953.1 hypothetical protein MYCFIDRAFT_195140 [Pseudocercospora fijiensis CIRAD86]